MERRRRGSGRRIIGDGRNGLRTQATSPLCGTEKEKEGEVEEEQDSCASAVAPTALEKAYQFGLTRNSHATFAFDDAKVRESRNKLPGSLKPNQEQCDGKKEKKVCADTPKVCGKGRADVENMIKRWIKDGQVCLGYDLGHGNISGCVPSSINDGNWHKHLTLFNCPSLSSSSFVVPSQIRVSRNKQRGLLMVDGLYSKQMTSPKKILYSINGCIRNLKMVGGAVSLKSPATGRAEAAIEDFKLDMAAPASSHMVGRCFVATEVGTYFEGTGFLKAVSSYRVGLDVSMALEFRTSRTNGVLLAVSNQGNDGLGLEIVQGKLLFHVDNGAGRITAEHVPEGEGFCDGQWHAVTASKIRHRVELVVDGKQSRAESATPRSNTCDTNDPIYVGGYPSGVRQAALSGSASFRGCMRNLKITKASKTMDVHFNKAPEIRGVQPLSCPAAAA
ncbi:hypothetical protein F2P81_024352 [Scophthalmus maximus]|uniref:Laminin G domain-containing protein n=1 Tax=Scophthalmus maximus TaxID=52904 RepID=A0A6A4RX74_SCOMX|nr:hypothetical protein F2P81_024352 [Scophthalmus maximus]